MKEARELFEQLLGFGGHLGHFSEMADSQSGEALGIFPPALTHVGRTVLVHTPGLAPDLAYLIDESEIRSYTTLDAWLADDCFPESPCPRNLGDGP